MKKRINSYDSVILILSLYVVAELIVSILVVYKPWQITVTSVIDTIICLFFIYDFVCRLRKANNKITFWKYNFIDLISSIPFSGFLRFGRIFRIIRILRMLRSGKQIIKIVKEKKSVSIFKMVVYLNIILIVFGSLSLLVLNEGTGTYKSFDSALWESIKIVLFSELPDDDAYTIIMKVIVLLMAISGMVLFGSFIGLISDIFISPEEEKLDNDIKLIKNQNKEILDRLRELSEKIDK